MEMTLDQQKAIAMASARLRLQQQSGNTANQGDQSSAATPSPNLSSISIATPFAPNFITQRIADSATNYIAQRIAERNAARNTPAQPSKVNLPVGSAVGESPSIPPEQNKPTPSIGDEIKGGGEAALTTATGMTTGLLGNIYGFLKQTAHELSTGQYGTTEAADKIEQAAHQYANLATYSPRTATGQRDVQVIGNIADQLTPIAPLSGELQPIAEAARIPPSTQSVKNAVQAGLESKPVQVATRVAESTPKPIVNIVTGQGKRQLAQDIKADPFNADYAGYKVVGNTAQVDHAANEAMKQGWRPGLITSMRMSDPTDMAAYQEMLNIFKTGKKNMRFQQENRPADVVGRTFSNRVNQLFNIKKQAAGELDTAAEGLKGTQVDYKPAFDNFENKLSDLGVQISRDENGKPTFSLNGSDIEGDAASQQLLDKVFKRLGNTESADGYDLHRMKRWLDTQVEFGKKSKDGLLNATANVVKGLRKDINQSLRDASPAYKAANQKYSDSLNSLEDIQKAVGSTKDLTGENVDKTLGQEARKLLSKYGNRVNMMDAISNAEDTVKKYGGNVKGDIISQMIFANEFDHMFGDVAAGSFQSKIRSGLETGLEAATKGKTALAMNLIKGGVKKLRGINELNAIKAMEKFIQSNKKGEYIPKNLPN